MNSFNLVKVVTVRIRIALVSFLALISFLSVVDKDKYGFNKRN